MQLPVPNNFMFGILRYNKACFLLSLSLLREKGAQNSRSPFLSLPFFLRKEAKRGLKLSYSLSFSLTIGGISSNSVKLGP